MSTFRKERRQVGRLLAARSGHSHYYFRLAGSQGAPLCGREQLITRGRVHTVRATAAAVADITQLPELYTERSVRSSAIKPTGKKTTASSLGRAEYVIGSTGGSPPGGR